MGCACRKKKKASYVNTKPGVRRKPHGPSTAGDETVIEKQALPAPSSPFQVEG